VKGLFLALAMMSWSAMAVAQDLDPAGTYAMVGKAMSGDAYEGTVTVTANGSVFAVSYTESDGNAYTGAGLVAGGLFVVAANADGKNTVSALTPTASGFDAVWAYEVDPGTGTETWTRQ
jgi:hypothetical protein